MQQSEELRIDSHKLIFHPRRVADWMEGKDIYPIYVEVSPTGLCNYRCIFCALDFLGYEKHFIDPELFFHNVNIMAQNGVRSIMFAGEGEPLLNPHTPEFVNYTKQKGIDVSLTSNCSLFTKEVTRECMHSFSWVRCSFNAGTEEKYKEIHKCKSGDYRKVIDNLGYMVEFKKAKNLATTIGMQMVLVPENADTVFQAAATAAEIGVDYFSVKPFSKHPMSICDIDQEFQYRSFLDMGKELAEKYLGKLKIVFRSHAMEKLENVRQYSACRALPFWAYIDSQSRVWGCSAHFGEERFICGDLHNESFDQIWKGEKRKSLLNYVNNELDVETCRENCRMDEINIYLHELMNPGPHVNFI